MKVLNIERNIGAIALDFEVSTTHSYILKNNILSHNSMKGVLEHSDTKKEEVKIERKDAPKRPEEMKCDIHEVTLSGKKFIVLVGMLNGSPYEIFVDENNEGNIDVNHHKDGFIRKNGKGKYSLVIKNGVEKVVVDNLAATFDQTYGVLARMVSMSLRHGVPLHFIVEQLQKSKHFMSFEKVVARVIKKYIADGEKVSGSASCGECGSTDLVYKEGCLTCTQCGGSKCS